MNPLRVSDGSKFASFDGFVLEVSGLSGSASSRRIAVESIESVTVGPAGSEWMFGVKTGKGGFGLVVSKACAADWEALAAAVRAALPAR